MKRFFLFFKENDIFSTDLYDNYRNEERAIKSICDLGSRQQVAQDLLTVDGPGLDERAGGQSNILMISLYKLFIFIIVLS